MLCSLTVRYELRVLVGLKRDTGGARQACPTRAAFGVTQHFCLFLLSFFNISDFRISKVPIKVMEFHYFWVPGRCPPPKTSIKVTEFQRSEIESDGPPLWRFREASLGPHFCTRLTVFQQKCNSGFQIGHLGSINFFIFIRKIKHFAHAEIPAFRTFLGIQNDALKTSNGTRWLLL